MNKLHLLLGLALLFLDSGSGQFSSHRFNQQQFTQPFGQQQVTQQPFGQQQPSQSQFRGSGGLSCPEKNGRFVHNSQCDAYIECIDGVAEEKLCPDGLLFNPESRFGYPCGYPVNVNCEGRTAVQPAQVTDGCPHSFGYFRTADTRNCGQFVNCVAGKAYNFDCPLGLAFNEATLQCDWPDQVPTCDAEAFLGFSCPAPQGAFPINYELFRNQADCTKYFVCLNGRPRLLSCPEGMGFSEEVGDCVDAATVQGCQAAVIKRPPEQQPLQRFPTTSRFGRK